jgi:hypothetical protein
MAHYKNHHASSKASSVRMSEKSLSEQIDAFQKSGGTIEVLGNTPALRRTLAKSEALLAAGAAASGGEPASNDEKE